MPAHKSGKKNRKHNRNKDTPSFKAYLVEGRREKNKAKKLGAHKLKHPNDLTKVGTIPDYKVVRLNPKDADELSRKRVWKLYLKQGVN